MFIEIRITAKDALKHIMLNNHSPLNDKTTEAIYKTIMKAEIDEGFAMHNCVGKCYASRQGDTAIVIFLHKDGQPCVDVEIDPKTFAIRQCRAVCNHDAEKNHWELARLVAAEIKNLYRKAA